MTPVTPSPTFKLRERLCSIARQYEGKRETVAKNQAPWIKPLWAATTYPNGMEKHEPYCATGLAWCVREWLKDSEVLAAFKMTAAQAEKWRCKSSSCFKAPDSWLAWAKKNSDRVQILPRNVILHAGDIVIYEISHIGLVTNDDNTPTGPFVDFGFNTNAAGARDGEGAFEKPRVRSGVKCFLRILA